MCISIPHPPPLRQIFFPGVKIFTVFSLIVFYKNIYPCSYEITGVYISQNIISLQPVKRDLETSKMPSFMVSLNTLSTIE